MNLPVEELEIGMYVEIPLSWHEHPFLKNSFLITSEEEIRKIKDSGIRHVKVDFGRSRCLAAVGKPPVEPEGGSNPAEEEDVVPPELISSIHDRTLAAEKRAHLVIEHSLVMMQGLLEKPSTLRIDQAKRGISEIVNLILRDDHAAYYLININTHDFYTYTHSVNVGILGVTLAKAIFQNTSTHDIHALGVGFFLHDLGKVRVDQAIINKPAKLTEEEMREIRRHPAHGFKILLETRQLTEESRLVVLQHHERYDGSGYPRGLRKDEIHIYARLCSLADVYDALTSERPYKKSMTSFEALKLMREEMLFHFQTELFEKFVLMFRAPNHARLN
ncbi:MAG: HD-GYP domain-containing protein [Pseudomonadota bacterium]|nr:HD-GYP domain-containing protein [Pseudomonadota bacterium]